MSKHSIYRMIWIPSAVLLVAMTALFSRQTEATPGIAPMTTYTTGDKSLSVRHPGNWKAHETGANAVLTMVRFMPSANVRVTITTDLAGSLFADIQKSNNDSLSSLPGIGQTIAAKQKTPLENVHQMQAAQMRKDSDYPEFQDGTTQKAQVAGYEALVTGFTYKQSGLFGSTEMIGQRVTALAEERRLTFVASCPKAMQKELGPVFQEMLESLQVGQTGG